LRNVGRALVVLFAGLAAADEPARPDQPARIRIAGIFLQGFTAWRTESMSCMAPAGKPLLDAQCGFFKCPKPKLLGIPLDLDYSNWQKSPRVSEFEIEPGKPFGLHFGGTLVTGTIGDAARLITGGTATLNAAGCMFDAKFTPRPGGMYEATIDPATGGGCFLRLTEIRSTDTGLHERVKIEDVEVKACSR
jgi:hypothetical protein